MFELEFDGEALPLHKAAAAATPIRAATHGIAIAQIAPVDKPLLLLFRF